jgi:hypothetical protein
VVTLMTPDSPFARVAPEDATVPLTGSGGRDICIVFCNECLRHWLSPIPNPKCGCNGENTKVELLKRYQTKATRV